MGVWGGGRSEDNFQESETSTMGVLGIELSSLGLVLRAFTH